MSNDTVGEDRLDTAVSIMIAYEITTGVLWAHQNELLILFESLT